MQVEIASKMAPGRPISRYLAIVRLGDLKRALASLPLPWTGRPVVKISFSTERGIAFYPPATYIVYRFNRAIRTIVEGGETWRRVAIDISGCSVPESVERRCWRVPRASLNSVQSVFTSAQRSQNGSRLRRPRTTDARKHVSVVSPRNSQRFYSAADAERWTLKCQPGEKKSYVRGNSNPSEWRDRRKGCTKRKLLNYTLRSLNSFLWKPRDDPVRR